MVISAAARVAVKALKIAKAKKHVLQQRKYMERRKAKRLSAVAKKTIKKTDYFIRNKPLSPTPDSVLPRFVVSTGGVHVKHGVVAPPTRDFSPKHDMHKIKYHDNTNIASIEPLDTFDSRHTLEWNKRNTSYNLSTPYWDSFKLPKYRDGIISQKLIPDKIQTKKTDTMTPGESARKSWWTEFFKQSRAGKHLGVAGAAGGLGVYATSKRGKK